jgi:hypothetical protein
MLKSMANCKACNSIVRAPGGYTVAIGRSQQNTAMAAKAGVFE